MIIPFPGSPAVPPSGSDDLGPVKRFRLEALLEQPTDPNIHVTVEIERLISVKKYSKAYDLYMSDGIDDPPDDYDVFLAKYIDPEYNKLSDTDD